MKEAERHRQAFELFYKLRNESELARRLSVSRQSVVTWKREFNWDDRCIIRDREVAAGVEKKIIPELVSERAKMIADLKRIKQIAFAGINTAFVRDPKGELVKDEKGNPILLISVERVRDLKDLGELVLRLTEAELKALGEPDRAEVRVIEVKYDEDVDRDRQTEAPAPKATADSQKPREA